MKTKNKIDKTKTEEQQALEDLKRRVYEMQSEEERLKANTLSASEYLENIRKTHKDPYWMSYEVVELRTASPVQTVFTSESYDEAFDVWKKLFYENGHGRMDLVVRERKTGVPLFRTIVLEMELAGTHGDTFDGKPSFSSCYNVSDWGRFGPSVYNHDYKDKPWSGYEAYSKPLKLFYFQESDA